MASIEDRINALENLLGQLITDIRETRTTISAGFEKIDENFIKIHEKIDTFSGKTAKNFQKVDLNLSSIQEEISKINSVTGYEDAINNLKIIQGGKQ